MNYKPKMIIDGHFDLLGDILIKRNSGKTKVIEMEYLDDFIKGGVTTVVASIFIDSIHVPSDSLRQAIEQISVLYAEVIESPDKIMVCKTYADILKAHKENKIGFILSLEGAEPVLSVNILHALYELGVRGFGLAWSRRNMAADGCDFSGNLKKGGLTSFGIELVNKAVELGMIIDISHLSDEGVTDVFEMTNAPFIASHSNVRAIAKSNRNLTDDQLRKLASRKCVVGINAASLLVADNNEDANEEKLMEHLDYMINIMGDDHVALGFDLCDRFLNSFSINDLKILKNIPFDVIKGHSKVSEFIKKLCDKYSVETIDKITHKNWLRIYESILK